MKRQCKNYVGVACVNGSCLIASAEDYEERQMPVVKKCSDCFYYKGCEDCALDGTEYCDKTDKLKFRRRKKCATHWDIKTFAPPAKVVRQKTKSWFAETKMESFTDCLLKVF